jgi:hypothetical protein
MVTVKVLHARMHACMHACGTGSLTWGSSEQHLTTISLSLAIKSDEQERVTACTVADPPASSQAVKRQPPTKLPQMRNKPIYLRPKGEQISPELRTNKVWDKMR